MEIRNITDDLREMIFAVHSSMIEGTPVSKTVASEPVSIVRPVTFTKPKQAESQQKLQHYLDMNTMVCLQLWMSHKLISHLNVNISLFMTHPLFDHVLFGLLIFSCHFLDASHAHIPF